MAEYIDKSFVLYVIHHFGSMQTWSKQDIVSECVRKITSEKAADVVEVVRCKECILHEDFPHNVNLYCNRFDGVVKSDGFCNYGKKDLEESK